MVVSCLNHFFIIIKRKSRLFTSLALVNFLPKFSMVPLINVLETFIEDALINYIFYKLTSILIKK